MPESTNRPWFDLVTVLVAVAIGLAAAFLMANGYARRQAERAPEPGRWIPREDLDEKKYQEALEELRRDQEATRRGP